MPRTAARKPSVLYGLPQKRTTSHAINAYAVQVFQALDMCVGGWVFPLCIAKQSAYVIGRVVLHGQFERSLRILPA